MLEQIIDLEKQIIELKKTNALLEQRIVILSFMYEKLDAAINRYFSPDALVGVYHYITNELREYLEML
jgi:hypothetical protein